MTNPRPVIVRPGYTEQDTWRAALGNAEPLRVFAAIGDCIDAPDVMPAGAMRAAAEPLPVVTFRS